MYQIHRLMVERRGGLPVRLRKGAAFLLRFRRCGLRGRLLLRCALFRYSIRLGLLCLGSIRRRVEHDHRQAGLFQHLGLRGARAAAGCLPAPAHTELPARRSPAAVPPSPAHRRKAGSGNGGSPHWQRQDGGSTAPPERAGSGAVSRFPVRPAPSFPPLPAPCAERGGIHGQRRHNNAPHSAAHWSCGSSAIRCAARCRLVPSLLLPLTRARDHAPSRAVHTVTYKLTCAYSGSPAARRSNGCRCSLPPPALRRCLRRQQAAALRHPRRTHQS